MKLSQKEKQKIKDTLQSAARKMIKQLRQGKMVSLLEYYELCQNAFKDDVWLGSISKLTYQYTDYSSLNVDIKCKYLDTKFKVTFFMSEPHGKFDDRTPIAYNLNVEEILKEKR